MQSFTRIMSSVWLFAMLSQLVACAILNVTVGGPAGLAYDPEFVNAEAGDTIRFIFEQENHTATQSSFEQPCVDVDGGFDTGFIPVPDTQTTNFPVAQLQIGDTKPIWVYCRQGNHCKQGMVFAVNPGNDSVFTAFKEAAMNPQPPSSPSSGSPNPPSGSSSAPAPSGTPAVNSTTPATGAATPSSSPNPAPVVTVTNVVTATPVPTVSSTPNNPGTKPESVGYKVVVGGPGGKFSFQPSSLKANPGDSIIFEFQQNNHTVTASSFAQPCEPLSETSTSGEAGFDSGFMPVPDSATSFPTYTIRVNDTQTIWAYCRQEGHCKFGMVFAVNAPDDGSSTFGAFQSLAENSGSSANVQNNASPNHGARMSIVYMTVMFAVAGGLL